ncbi:PWWP domain-containing protein 5-like [Phragmites australis]|uniref:PWWP domain-containing protein 5-like n=1 Tax=Phragmites australis TaxID=29695 RepID=UPI002D7A233D|nr:PWWP domain-containing protein 5-like [Phragmites australis]
MAPSPVVEEGASAHVEVPKIAALGQGSTMRRPGRLRVMHPHVAEFLRSPRRVRAKKPAPPPSPRAAEGEGEGERARYDCVFEDDEEGKCGFAAPRLVWGKVRHYPWWPGQVFDPTDASELAKRQKRGRRAILVAYFWDKTFAWVDPAALRPFRGGFPRLAAQSAMSPFALGVDAALGEVARRVDVGLSCSCAGHKANKQVIDNAGVREGAYGAAVDAAFARGAFRGEAIVAYISALATAPLAGCDRVDLTIATAQLKAFSRWKGSRGLPEYTFFHGIEGVAMEAASARAKKRRSRGGGDDGACGKWKMSRSGARGNARCENVDDALELEDLEHCSQTTPQQMSTKIGKLMSRAAQQMSRSPVIRRANSNAPQAISPMARCTRVADELPSVNSGDLTCKVPQVDERRPAEDMENPLQAGLVLNFSSPSSVPSTSDLTMIFSRFGPIKEVRAENSVALVIFKKRAHAEDAFSGTAKISAISAYLISFRLTYSLPAAPIDPPHRMLSSEEMDSSPLILFSS